MGCLQNRPLAENSNIERISRSQSFEKVEPSTSLLNSSSANNLILLLKSNYDSQNWSFLLTQISNKTKIHQMTPSPSWAKNPKSIGSLALVYISKGAKKYPKELLPIFKESQKLVTELLKAGSEDFKEQSILFINYLTVLEDPGFQCMLTEVNIFPLIIPHFYSEKFELRHICATACSRLYKENPAGQSLFISSDGVKALIHIISQGPLRGRFFSRLLQCVLDLLYSNEKVSIPNAEAVIPYIDQSLLNSIDVSLMNDPVRDKFFELISVLHSISN